MKRHWILLYATLLLVAACTAVKRDLDVQTPHGELPKGYLAQANDTLFAQQEATAQWWGHFSDPMLDTLIERARRHNLAINVAVANFQAARAVFRESKFDRYPTVGASGDYTRQRLGENVFAPGRNPVFNQFNGGFDAFWEANLFGRVTNRVREARAFQQAAKADARGVYVSVFAEVAQLYVELRGAQHLLDIARRNLANQQETYDLVERLVVAGTSNTLDLARAEAQLENTRATIAPLTARVAVLANSLAVLVGKTPGALDSALAVAKPLPHLPPTVLVGDAHALLRRRPDVARAEQDFMRQAARYNLAVAELYPNVTFGGNIGFSAIDFSSFGKNRSFTWAFAPRITWAAFNLGRVRRQIDQQDALAVAAANQYEQTVLGALEETKNAMENYQHELERREVLRKAFQASAQARELAQDRYEAGLDSFLDYLNADRTLLQAEVGLANSEISAVTGLIAIHKALGGGWEIITDQAWRDKFDRLRENDGTL